MFREGDEAVSEKTFVELSYAQASLDYLSGSYPVPFEEACRLAALQAGAEGCVGVGVGGGEEEVEVEGGGGGGGGEERGAENNIAAFAAALASGRDRAAASDALDAFVPRSILEASSRDVSRRQWRKGIAEAARELLFCSSPPPSAAAAAAAVVISPAAARSLFLSRLRALPYGGCLFFPVRRVQDPVGLLPPGRLSLGVNARGLHFFRGGGGSGESESGFGGDGDDGGGENDHHLHHLYSSSSPSPSASSSSAPREYLYSAELRDIMQFGSSASSVFFKMRVAGVLRVFQFETLGRRGGGGGSVSGGSGGGGGGSGSGEGDAVCLALQTHINDVMARRFHHLGDNGSSPSLPAASNAASAASAAAAEREVEELRRKLAAALSEAAAARSSSSSSSAATPAPAAKAPSAAAVAAAAAATSSSALEAVELERLRQQASRAEGEAQLLREEASRTAALVAAQASRNAELERAYAAEALARKRAHNEAADLRGRIRVFARVRPLSEAEKRRGMGLALSFPDALTLAHEARGKRRKKNVFFFGSFSFSFSSKQNFLQLFF